MKNIEIAIQRLSHAKDLALPNYSTSLSSGADLLAAIANDQILLPRKRILIPTGIAIALPIGYEAQVRPRSGLALKNGITCLNTPGTIDADYRGEIGVILINHSEESFCISRGMRIAQLVVSIYFSIKWNEVASLEKTKRGDGGFGSTGF